MIIAYLHRHARFQSLQVYVPRPDDLMQYRTCFCLFRFHFCRLPARGCRLSEPPHNVYQRRQQRRGLYSSQKRRTPVAGEVNFKRLRRLPPLD
ncbi:hypothetical protein KCP78_19910 [Salmonella enterica subsp. enterica]|nr:hypothetical protein KCP78_19910 [Salmonella enterica subsp. enterica]